MHNGAFVALEDAVRHHLDPVASTLAYAPSALPSDLVAFVRDGLLDPGALPRRLRQLIPETLPSGRPPLAFEFP